MNLITRILSLYKWTWVGTVEGPKDNGERIPLWDRPCYWNLYQRGDGKRKVVRVGRWSPSAGLGEAQVEAWQNGGPLPSLVPEYKPKAARPVLVLLQGGKGAR